MPDHRRTSLSLPTISYAAAPLALLLAFGPSPAQAQEFSESNMLPLWDGGDQHPPPNDRIEDNGDTEETERTDETGEQHTTRRPRTSRGVHRPKRSVHSDLTSSWFHIGGGGGGVVPQILDPQVTQAGRFVVGGGGYTFFAYGGGELSVTGHAADPLSLTAAAFAGLALPIPIVHPLIGLRAGAGHHLAEGGLAPHVAIGPQVGLIVRQFDGRPGVRIMADAGVEYRIEEMSLRPEIFVTVSAVF